MKYLAGDKARLKFFVKKKQTSQSTFVSVANIALSLTASLLLIKGWHSDSEEMFYCLLFVVYGLLDLLKWHKKLFLYKQKWCQTTHWSICFPNVGSLPEWY